MSKKTELTKAHSKGKPKPVRVYPPGVKPMLEGKGFIVTCSVLGCTVSWYRRLVPSEPQKCSEHR